MVLPGVKKDNQDLNRNNKVKLVLVSIMLIRE